MATAGACIWERPGRVGVGISRVKMRDPVVLSLVAIVGRSETLTARVFGTRRQRCEVLEQED